MKASSKIFSGGTKPREIAYAARDFPDRASVAYLRRLGVRTVVLHPALAAGTSWQAAAAKPVAGLGLSRERRGAVIVYALPPAR